MLNNKKSQITIFIIAGIVILFTIMAFFFLRVRIIESETGNEAQIGDVPNWALPVKEFIDICLEDVTIDAFKKLGEHGGYIDMQDVYLSEKSFRISDDPVESDAVMLSRDVFSPIPYWWYMETQNTCYDCNMNSLAPRLTEIEGQVNRYINRELPKCLNDFSVFEGKDIQVVYGSTNATTSVNVDDVSVSIKLPLTISNLGRDTFMDEFNLDIDLSFQDMYDLALEIAANQINNQTLEDISMFLLNSYAPNPDESKIPPLVWIDKEDTTVSWEVEDVKEKIRDSILGSNIALIELDKTRDAQKVQMADPLAQGVYDIMFLEILEEEHPNHDVSFLYDPAWDLYFDITPTPLEPVTVETEFPLDFMPSTRTNYYEFFYDFSFPVVVIIRDDRSLKRHGEEGYTFMFAFEVNVRDNKNLFEFNQGRGTFGTADYSGVSPSFNAEQQTQGDCVETAGAWSCSVDGSSYNDQTSCVENCLNEPEPVVIEPIITDSLFCDKNQRLSGDILIRTFDANTGQSLPEVPISFTCGRYITCTMEQTDANAGYLGKFPLCFGDGRLRFQRDGYQTKVISNVTTKLGLSNQYDVYLEPYVDLEVEIVSINVTNLFRIENYLEDNMDDYDSIVNRIDSAIESVRFTPPQPLCNSTPNDPSCITPPDKLNSTEINLVKSEQRRAEAYLDIVRNTVGNITYWAGIKSHDVVGTTESAEEGLIILYRFVYDMINDQDYVNNIIGRTFTGNIPFDSAWIGDIGSYISVIDFEQQNIQFFDSTTLIDYEVISDVRSAYNVLAENQSVIISLSKLKDSMFETGIPTPQVTMAYGETTTISVVPGDYELNVNLLYNQVTSVPNFDGSGSFNYTPSNLGGVELNEDSGYWVISQNDLDSYSKIRFYVFRLEDPRTTEDVNEIGEIGSYSKKYRRYVQPEFLP